MLQIKARQHRVRFDALITGNHSVINTQSWGNRKHLLNNTATYFFILDILFLILYSIVLRWRQTHTDSKSSHELTLLLLQTNVINNRVNFHCSFVFSHYLFRALHFCLLDTKILALEDIRSVMYSAQDMTLKITTKTTCSNEVRNKAVQGIVGSSLTYISHDWPSLKSRALHTLSTLFRTAFRSIFPPHLGNISKNRLYPS